MRRFFVFPERIVQKFRRTSAQFQVKLGYEGDKAKKIGFEGFSTRSGTIWSYQGHGWSMVIINLESSTAHLRCPSD